MKTISLKKKIVVTLTTLLIVITIAKGWHVVTGGYRTNKIIPPKYIRCHIAELPQDIEKGFFTLFDQKFYFLDKGCQAYVFESEDKKHVIKFLRHHKYRAHFWMRFAFLSKYVNEYKKHYVESKKERIKRNFSSYILSLAELKDLTQVEYVHLDTTEHIAKKICLIDRFGQKTYVDLDKAHFVVQKKAENLQALLLKAYSEKKYDLAHNLIDKYFVLLTKRILKNVINSDRSGFIRNTALFGEDVIEIDVGGYVKNENLSTKNGFEEEYNKFAFRLNRWARRKTPHIAKYIQNKSDQVLAQTLKELE